MESMTVRIETTITHLKSLKRIDYTDEEFYLIILNAVEEYIPESIVAVYENLI
jgi:hypothetical protein